MIYRIKHLAKRIDRTPRTIKNWEKKGLIPSARRDSRGWRVYSGAEIKRLMKLVKSNNYFIHI